MYFLYRFYVVISLGYEVTDFGQTCSNMNLLFILEEHECKQAVESYGNTLKGVNTFPDNTKPKGCYLYGNSDKYQFGFFNTDESGRADHLSRSLCKRK